LVLQGNQLSSLPESFGQLTALQELVLQGNQPAHGAAGIVP